MTEKQFLNHARHIHELIAKLQKADWPVMEATEEEDITELLDKAKWTLHDVAYPA